MISPSGIRIGDRFKMLAPPRRGELGSDEVGFEANEMTISQEMVVGRKGYDAIYRFSFLCRLGSGEKKIRMNRDSMAPRMNRDRRMSRLIRSQETPHSGRDEDSFLRCLDRGGWFFYQVCRLRNKCDVFVRNYYTYYHQPFL